LHNYLIGPEWIFAGFAGEIPVSKVPLPLFNCFGITLELERQTVMLDLNLGEKYRVFVL